MIVVVLDKNWEMSMKFLGIGSESGLRFLDFGTTSRYYVLRSPNIVPLLQAG